MRWIARGIICGSGKKADTEPLRLEGKSFPLIIEAEEGSGPGLSVYDNPFFTILLMAVW
jgi:hypothetical protein